MLLAGRDCAVDLKTQIEVMQEQLQTQERAFIKELSINESVFRSELVSQCSRLCSLPLLFLTTCALSLQAEKDSAIATLHEKLAYGQQGPSKALLRVSGVSDTDEGAGVPPEEELTSWEIAGRTSLHRSDGGQQVKHATDAEEGPLLEAGDRQGIDDFVFIKESAAETSAQVHGIPAVAGPLSEIATVKPSQDSQARSPRQPRVLPTVPTRMRGSI